MNVKKYKSKEYIRGYSKYYVVSECHKCGQLFVGEVYSKSAEWAEISKAVRAELKTCPICDNNFMLKEEYSVWAEAQGNSTLQEQLQKELREKISQFEKEECRTVIAEHIAKLEPITDMPTNNEIVKEVKAEIPSLKVYIQRLIDLEIWSRFLEEQIISIYAKKMPITKAKTYTKTLTEKSARKKNERKEEKLWGEIHRLQERFYLTDWVGEVKPVEIIVPEKPKYLKEEKPQKPVMPEIKKYNFFNKKKILAENVSLQQEYEKACQIYENELKKLEETKNKNAAIRQAYEDELKKYNEKVEAEKERVTEEKKRLKAEAEGKKEKAKIELDKQIEKIKKMIQELKNSNEISAEESYVESVLQKEKDECFKALETVCETRNKLFSVNVIYPNYRDIFALSSFYEYFNSERCYALEGPDGAYNLYESERRGDSFSTFFRTLEDINKNQVVLYRETSNMFKNLQDLENSLKEATKTIADKEDDKICEKFVEEAFEKYFAKNEKFKQEIAKSVEDALAYLK